jgi:hypothetical protein
MAAKLPEKWVGENIPDTDFLYMWANRTLLNQLGADSGEIPPQIFREHQSAMSTFWNKYCTPEDAQNRAQKPNENGILELNVGQVRSIPPLQVIHDPDIASQNRAHTNVKGIETKGLKSEIRIKLSRIASWKIPIYI